MTFLSFIFIIFLLSWDVLVSFVVSLYYGGLLLLYSLFSNVILILCKSFILFSMNVVYPIFNKNYSKTGEYIRNEEKT